MVKYRDYFCTLELCSRAGDMLKAAGFVHFQTSMKTEAVYYRWPDRDHLLRVAEHGGKTRSGNRRGLAGRVVSSITFRGTHLDPPGTMNISEEKIEVMVAGAIGRYFLKSSPPCGKRG